jgi:hypothetical protein
MINDLTQDERQLAELMSELSQRCYSASWMKDLEYVLWDAVVSGPRDYGHSTITREDINKLVQTSDKVNSWILFDDELEEIPVPLDKWKVKFTEDTTQDPDRLHKNG